MCSILRIQDDYDLRDLLEVMSGATEWVIAWEFGVDSPRFADLRIRPGESPVTETSTSASH